MSSNTRIACSEKSTCKLQLLWHHEVHGLHPTLKAKENEDVKRIENYVRPFCCRFY